MTKVNNEWEKEFDNEFIYQYGSAFCCGGDYCDGNHTEEVSKNLKDFISKTLQQQREMDYKKFEKQLKAEIKRYRNLPGDTDFHKGRFCYAKELLQSLKENK